MVPTAASTAIGLVARCRALNFEAAMTAFNQLGLTRLEIVSLTHNQASQRVPQALGASFECEARNRTYFQGKPHNAPVYSLVPEDMGEQISTKIPSGQRT